MKREGKIAVGVSIAVVVLAGILGLIGWRVAAVASVNAIVVTTDAKPYTCVNPEDTKVIHEFGRYVPTILMSKDIDCTLRIRIHNDGQYPAKISLVRFDNFGPYGVVVNVDRIDGRAPVGANDAVSDPKDVIEIDPDRTYVLKAHIRAAKDVCMSDGGSEMISEGPSMTVTSLGVSLERYPTSVNFAFTGTPASDKLGCSSGGDIPINPYDRD